MNSPRTAPSELPHPAMLEEALNLSSDGVIVYQAIRDDAGVIRDYTLIALNDAATRLFGMDPEHVRGKPITSLWPGIEQDEIWPHCAEVVATRTPFQMEAQRTTPAGDTRYFDVTLRPYRDGFANSYRDITATKEALLRSEARRLAIELSSEKSRLDGVVEMVPLGLAVFESVRDAEGVLTDMLLIRTNEQARLLSGFPDDRYHQGMRLSDMLQEPFGHYFGEMLQVARTGKPLLFERRNVLTDRLISIRIVRHGDGLLCTLQDVTEIREHTHQMQQQAQLLEGVLQASPHAVLVFEAIRNAAGRIVDFRVIRFNKQAELFTGASGAYLSATTLFTGMPAVRHRLPHYQRVVELGEPETYEFYNEQVGQWRRITNTPFGDGFVMTMEDISPYKTQNRIIEEQAELFNGVLRSLQNGLTIFGIIRNESGELEDLRYLQIADSVERDTGMSRSEIVGQTIRGRYPGIEGTDYWRAYTELVRTGQPQHFESHFTLHGFDNYLLNWVTPLGHDKLVSVYYIVNDLKRAQRELEHTISELRRSNDDLEQFASVASHDLQEPLRKVQSFGNMLEARFADKLGDDGKDLVRRMQSAAGRMRDLVTGLLDFASLSRGKNDQLKPVNMDQLIREIIFDLDHAVDATGGRVYIDGHLPPVSGIQGQLRHLFHNLLTNAVKFRKADVRPVVSLKAVPLQAEDIAQLAPSVEPRQYTRIEVSDNGIGFDPIYAEKIFGLFERLHGLSQYQGTGIGLSICRRVAERHNGAIRAEGNPGVGSVFIVLLPKAEA